MPQITAEETVVTGPRLTTKEKTTIAALAAQGKTPHAIGKEIGRSENTVSAALKKPETALAVQDFTERFATKLEVAAERVLDAVTEADLEKASLKDKAIAAGVFFDKARLARGQSTSNVSLLFVVADQAETIRRGGTVIDVEAVEDTGD